MLPARCPWGGSLPPTAPRRRTECAAAAVRPAAGHTVAGASPRIAGGRPWRPAAHSGRPYPRCPVGLQQQWAKCATLCITTARCRGRSPRRPATKSQGRAACAHARRHQAPPPRLPVHQAQARWAELPRATQRSTRNQGQGKQAESPPAAAPSRGEAQAGWQPKLGPRFCRKQCDSAPCRWP